MSEASSNSDDAKTAIKGKTSRQKRKRVPQKQMDKGNATIVHNEQIIDFEEKLQQLEADIRDDPDLLTLCRATVRQHKKQVLEEDAAVHRTGGVRLQAFARLCG